MQSTLLQQFRRSHSRSLADKQYNFKFIDITHNWHQLLFKETNHDITGNKQIIFMFWSSVDFTSKALTINCSFIMLYEDTQMPWKGKIHLKLANIEITHFFNEAYTFTQIFSEIHERHLWGSIRRQQKHSGLKPETVHKINFSFLLEHASKLMGANIKQGEELLLTNLFSSTDSPKRRV